MTTAVMLLHIMKRALKIETTTIIEELVNKLLPIQSTKQAYPNSKARKHTKNEQPLQQLRHLDER